MKNNSFLDPELDAAREKFERAIREVFDAGLNKNQIDQMVDATLPPAAEALFSFDASSLEAEDVRPVEWIVDRMFPLNAVTGFFGDGGTGKDLLLFTLASAMVSANRWLGRDVMPGNVIYLPVEDDLSELRRRQAAIMEHYGIKSFVEFDHRLKIVPLAGQDTVLAAFDPKSGVVKPTALFDRVRRLVESFEPKLVIFPNRVNAFSVNQNDDAMARQCVQLLSGVALDYKCAAIMPSHPSLSGISSGTGTSGTVQWSNACRSRLYLSRVHDENKNESDPDVRQLETMKANWGPTGEKIVIRWINGVFIEDDGKIVTIGKNTKHEKADAVFLSLLDAYEKQGRYVSASPSSTFAPSIFASDPQSKGVKKRELREAMNRLFASNQIKIEEFGPASKRRSRITRNWSDEGDAQEAAE